MLVDPLVLKKKLNRMATEQGAFAVLSSLLLYVTELAAGDPELRSKRTKWAEGKENKVSYNQPCPDPNRGQHPTRFQLLRSRFLNSNREPYTKKRREVGKLVIKEKLWVSRAGNKLDRSRDRKGNGKAAEEDADTVPSERAKWSGMSGKNTVKNILKKFLAAEEKEAKEKSPSWKKKGSNNGLPKIVNKSSVLSKLKEQFEQSALCSAAEVKASLLRKGEKKPKSFPSRKTIRKPEVRVLRTAAMTATGINSPESQYLVCSTVPVPRLSIATEINHPWSWSKNNAAKQPFGHDAPLKEKRGAEREPGENKTPAYAAQDRGDKEELSVAPEAMSDAKDHAEAKIDSIKQGRNFSPNLDSSSTISKNKGLADCIPPSSEHALDCDRNDMPAGPDTSSLLGTTNAVQHVKEDSPNSNSSYSSRAEGSHEQSSQDTGRIPEITMYVYSSEEADTEFTEPENDPFFAGQKYFPEQKALENILLFRSPGVQASCEVEPPMEDRQLTILTPASGERPPIVQKEASGLRGRCSEEAKKEVKYHSEDKIFSASIKNGSDIPTNKEEEIKTPNSQMQDESKTKQPQPPQMPSPQNNFINFSADISNPEVNQTKSTHSSNESQEQKPGAAEEEHISSHLEKTQSPLPDDLVKHSFYIAEEDFGRDKLSLPNEMMNHANNGALGRSTLTDLETCHNQSKTFIKREEATADEMPWPDSETCQSHSSITLPKPMNGITGQRIHHTLGNPPALPPIDLTRQGAGGVEDKHASHGHEKHLLPSSDELTNCGNDTTVEKKMACDFKNQVLFPNHATENENSATEVTKECQSFENHLSLLTKKPGKQENKTTLTRKPLVPLQKNRTPTSDDTMKQGSDIPSSAELVPDQKKHAKGSNKVSKHKKDELLSSYDDRKHENDKMETEETEERNVLHKSEEEQVSTSSDTMDHDNNSLNEKNAHSPQPSQLPSSDHDINIQGEKNTGQSLQCLTPSSSTSFVKEEHDLTGDENFPCNNGKHHLYSSNEPKKHANDSAGEKNIKSNFKNYSMPVRKTSRQENKTTDEENTPPNLKKEPVQHKKSCEEEKNTLCDPKNQIPSPNPLVKQENKSSPLEKQKQKSPGDFVKPETKSAEKKTKHTSEKPQSPPPNKVLKPQARSSSGERKQKTPAAEDTRSPETKAVKDGNEHQRSGKYQLLPSRKSSKSDENVPGGEKQQTRCEDFMTPDRNAAKEKNKFPSFKKYRSVSSETLVKPQEKNTPEQKQQTSASAGFKKPGSNDVKEKDGDPNSEKSPSSKGVMKSQEKNISGDRRQKTPAAEDNRSPEAKAAKDDNEHQRSGKHQLPPSRKSAKSEENTLGGEKQQTRCEDFMTPDTNVAKEKNKFPSFKKYRSVSSETLVRPQEKNTPEQKQQTSASAGFKKPGSNDVKEKDGDPNSEKSSSSKGVMKSQEKNTSGDRRQKTPAAEDIRSPETKAVKEDSKDQHSGNHQLPPSSKPAKPEKNIPGREKQKTVSESFTKADASAVKDKSKDLGSELCQSPPSNSLVKPQEKNLTVKKKQSPPQPDEKTTYKTGSPEKKSRPERKEKYQLRSSALSEKHSDDGSGKEGSVRNFKSYQAQLPSDDTNYESNTVPKETSLPNTKKPPKSSSFHVASKDEETPAGNRKQHPGFKKYQALSSKSLVRHEKDVAEREGSWQAAGQASEREAELEDCSKTAPFSKYTVESYSERPSDSSFKPLIIRVPDTFKHHS